MFAFCSHGLPLPALPHYLIRLRVRDALVEILVAHHHRCGAATREAFDELDGKLAVLRGLQAVPMRVETELGAEVFVQLSGTAERAAQRAADFDHVLACRLLAEHRIERDELVNVDRLQAELLRGPLDGLLREPAEVFLQRVQQHQRRAPLLVRRIMRDEFVDLGFELAGNGEIHADASKNHSALSNSRETPVSTSAVSASPRPADMSTAARMEFAASAKRSVRAPVNASCSARR